MLLRGINLFFCSLFIISGLAAQNDSTITFSEVMFYPESGPNEFIEIYNYSTSEAIDLGGFEIVYYTANSDVITDAGGGTVLQPQSFAVIFEGDYPIGSGIYDSSIPANALILKITDNAFGSSGMANTSDRPLWLISVSGDTLEAYIYSANNSSSYSDEKIELINDSSFANWGNCEIVNGTPGFRNSISPINFDLEVSALTLSPEIPIVNEDVTIYAMIKNRGLSNANFYSVGIYNDADFDTTASQGELIFTENYLDLQLGDSILASTAIYFDSEGDYQIIAVVNFNEDENLINNEMIISVYVYPEGINFNDIIINEVMYAPLEEEPEWFELKNISGNAINLKNWSVSDILSTPTKNVITSDDIFIEPEEFIVITHDTSFSGFYPDVTAQVFYVDFGSLNNDEDGVILYDFRNHIIDSLLYDSDWDGKNGFSLERISSTDETNNKQNWITSLNLNRSTPGVPNSVVEIPPYQRNTLVINEIMYEPDDDNSEYLEFYNLSGENVNIGGWRIEDENENTYKLSETTLYVNPDSYFVLSSDSLIISKYALQEDAPVNILNESNLGLVNTGELIQLKDLRGNIIDSVWYTDKWHNDNFVLTRNISLERINPNLNGNDASNWSSSADLSGGTPTRQNSIFTDNTNLQSNISVSPNPFSPDNDGFEDFTIINYNLSQSISQVRIKIFDSKGRLVRTLWNNQASGPAGSVIFDGKDDSGEALRIGIYIIFLEAINEGSGVVETMKKVVVVARKL